MTERENFLLLTDSYKLNHFDMIVDGTENFYDYFESRQGAKYPYTVFNGLQPILKRYFTGQVVTQADIDDAHAFSTAHFGFDKFNLGMWQHIVNVHGGRLPLRIKAVPEGTPVPISNVMFTVEATDKVVAPLVGISETILTHVWHPSNVATIGMDIRLVLEKAFEKTDDETTNFLLDFMLHDFGFRGVSSVESAGAGGCAHLIPFKGTDTLIGIRYAQRYYGAGMAGFSVAASEHSIMTSLGEAGEFDVVRQLIARYSKGILSVVMDSYNTERFIRVCGTTLKDAILNRDGKFVFRPDSPRFKGDKACDQILWIAQQLEHYFGATVNKKGYKVLNPKVGIIYGDGLSVDEIKESIDLLVKSGYAASTCVYGMGGGLLQKHNRDTQRNAFKCSAQFRGNEWVDIFKNPLDKTKASKRGRMKLVWNESSHAKTLVTVPETDSRPDVMQTVFENGEMVREYTWNEVQTNSKLRFAGM